MLETETKDQLFETIEGTCRRIKCGKTKVYDMINAGELEAVKLDGKRLVTERSIQALADRLMSQAQWRAA